MLTKHFFVVLMCCVFSAPYANAQNKLYKIDQSQETTWSLLKYDINATWHSVKHSFTRPIKWKKKDFTKFGGLIVGTAVLSLADEEAYDFAIRQRDGTPKIVRDFGWYFGNPQNYFIANAGLYGYGLFTKNEKVRRTSVLIISSSVTTGLIQTFAKNGFGRARPSQELGAHYFEPFSKEPGLHSFPSGHTVLSVTMSHAIAKQFENPWVKAGIYTIGAIPPISRLVDGAHWLTDVTFGAILSIVVVDGIDKFLYKNESHNIPYAKPKAISWNISFGPNKVGLVGTF
ncbi:phosphatase PAP2 family protein [Seonamhaeicola marinus]|uniref:Phosphatase PAP2 family protein n=1 Tax=Seonamhaeicola marinus TaxID=1912246 RepID=A0A5D0I4T6_9FLAO|nr:phosphatase PAP2 family protein [Seonamhaeicola marinus]TYA78753.1 phosphatase PAP2 family protein [Seonamhaeicola marinus]